MVERKEITIEAQSVFARYIQNENNSTYNFTNMFMWADGSGITYAETDGCLALFFEFGRQPVSVSFPVGGGDTKSAVSHLAAYIEEQGLRPVFRNLSKDMCRQMEELFLGQFEFVEDRSAADYIYETESLILLSGKKLHQKRNHFNYFKNHYAYEYRTLTQADMEDCLQLYKNWEDEKESGNRLAGARQATERLLHHFDSLPVRGGGLFVADKLVAFSIGERVSNDTALIHLEFATDLRGAFNVINSEFCAHEWSDCAYINREEDMGIPGLRQAKMAYRPIRLLEKYNAVLKESFIL